MCPLITLAQAEKAVRMMRRYAGYNEDAPGCILKIPK